MITLDFQPEESFNFCILGNPLRRHRHTQIDRQTKTDRQREKEREGDRERRERGTERQRKQR